MLKKRYGYFALFISIALCGIVSWAYLTSSQEPVLTPQSNEFIETKVETAETQTWLDSSLDSILDAAKDGNASAIYHVGMIHLLGLQVPVNIDSANMYFGLSASLGFGPAINKLKFKYIEDYPNIFLSMVYLNLSIAFGHNELTQCYHHLINQMSKQFKSTKLKQAIEMVAQKKFETILQNQQDFKSLPSKNKFLEVIVDITHEDKFLDLNYWKKVVETPQRNSNE